MHLWDGVHKVFSNSAEQVSACSDCYAHIKAGVREVAVLDKVLHVTVPQLGPFHPGHERLGLKELCE